MCEYYSPNSVEPAKNKPAKNKLNGSKDAVALKDHNHALYLPEFNLTTGESPVKVDHTYDREYTLTGLHLECSILKGSPIKSEESGFPKFDLPNWFIKTFWIQTFKTVLTAASLLRRSNGQN